MNIVLYDNSAWKQLLPITFTRPVSGIRVGILTLREKWEAELKQKVACVTQPHLSKKFNDVSTSGNCIYVAGNLFPNDALIEAISKLAPNEMLLKDTDVLAYHSDKKLDLLASTSMFKKVEFRSTYQSIKRPWDIFLFNGREIEADIIRLELEPNPSILDHTNTLIGNRVFVAENARVQGAILNTSGGSIYIGPEAEVMEGSVIRGPFALGEHSSIKMSSKMYGDTSIGPHCKVGGEVSNVVFQGYANKGHDGFLGNSVIGEWCNLGADTNSSNLKNNYGKIQVWDYETEAMSNTGQQFCGLIMGDHSKTGINTMLNTGTVTGVCANIFDAGFPPKFIPSFSWGGTSGFETFRLDKAFEVAQRMMERRGLNISEEDKEIFKFCFNHDAKYRG
ncbi:MAG: GlmU family protein [Flavobacteriales bacterium]|nr:GlmU family protein [Flavobacteriales bacterium]